MTNEVKDFLKEVAELQAKLKRLRPELSQYTKGQTVIKGITAAAQLLEMQSKEAA